MRSNGGPGRLKPVDPRGHARHSWPRGPSPRLIPLLVLLLILGVLGMHQLASDHALIAPQPPALTYSPDTHRVHTSDQQAARDVLHLEPHLRAIPGSSGASWGTTADCADCDSHAWSVICLLALALLAALNTTRGPTSHSRPVVHHWASDPMVGRTVSRARSWIELSVFRT